MEVATTTNAPEVFSLFNKSNATSEQLNTQTNYDGVCIGNMVPFSFTPTIHQFFLVSSAFTKRVSLFFYKEIKLRTGKKNYQFFITF